MSVWGRLRRDSAGVSVIEFALLAPVILGLMLGVLQIGVQMLGYNAVRSVAADTVRYTMIEYQKEDKLTADQIETKANAIAGLPPYNLSGDRYSAAVTNPASDIAGMKKFKLVLNYTPPNPLGVLRIDAMVMTWTRVFYVTAS